MIALKMLNNYYPIKDFENYKEILRVQKELQDLQNNLYIDISMLDEEGKLYEIWKEEKDKSMDEAVKNC